MKIVTYDLQSDSDFSNFNEFRKDFLSILEICYKKNRYFGNAVYNKKIQNRDFVILLVFSPQNIPIGTAFYKHNGKLSGLAVLEPYRKSNVARLLIYHLKSTLKYIFAEIGKDNPIMQRFLSIEGFRIVEDLEVISKNLMGEKITFLKVTGEQEYIYIHGKSRLKMPYMRKFIMLEFNNDYPPKLKAGF